MAEAAAVAPSCSPYVSVLGILSDTCLRTDY
jgi:hypothetical protein